MRDNEILKQSESKKNEMILNLEKESM
jgi:hypothetical protein